jgi:hypothetical protein
VDKREVEYTEARAELLREMLRAGAFDMSDDLRRDFVASTVRDLQPRYPELVYHLWRQLIGNGIRATSGDATLAAGAAGRGEGEEEV